MKAWRNDFDEEVDAIHKVVFVHTEEGIRSILVNMFRM